MIGDKLTRNLTQIINSNINDNIEKEQLTMAKLNANKDGRNEEVVGEVDKIQEAALAADDIIKNAMKTADAAKATGDAAYLAKTENFTGTDGSGIDEADMTPEEIAEARLKDEARAQRRQKAIEHNQFVETAFAEIKSTLGDRTISDEHEALQIACREYGRHEGFLMAEGERSTLRISRTFPRDRDKNLQFKPGVPQDIKEEIISNNLRKSEKKADHLVYQASLKYTMSAPKTQFGSIVSIPEVLNVNLLSLNKGDFDVPTKEEIKKSNKMVFALGTEAFFTFLMLYFRGEIRENDAVLETKAKYTSDQNWLIGSVSAVMVTDRSTRKQSRTLRKRITSKCRPSVYIPENIIPYKIYDTSAITSLDADTRDAYIASLSRTLSAGTEKEAKYKYLDEQSSKIISAQLSSDDKEVESLEVGLFTGAVVPGIGDGAGFDLKHWANHVRQPSGTFEKVSAPAVVTKMFASVSETTGNTSYKPVVKFLGLDIQLPELAALGYPAAGRVHEMGVTESDISNLMENYRLEVKQKREAAKLANPNRSNAAKTISRRSNELASKDATNLFFQTLMGDAKPEGLDINTEAIREGLMTASLRA